MEDMVVVVEGAGGETRAARGDATLLASKTGVAMVWTENGV